MKKGNKLILIILIIKDFLFVNFNNILLQSNGFNNNSNKISMQTSRLKEESYSLPKITKLRIKDITKEEIKLKFNFLFINPDISINIQNKFNKKIFIKPLIFLFKKNKKIYIEKDDF